MLINLSILARLSGVIVAACQGIVLPEIYMMAWWVGWVGWVVSSFHSLY